MNYGQKIATSVAALILALTAGSSWAVCDPATTETPAEHGSINAAIQAASPGETVCIPAGTYNENLCVTGTQAVPGVCDPADGPRPGITITGDPDVSREQVKINALNGPPDDRGTGPGIFILGSGVTVQNLIVLNALEDAGVAAPASVIPDGTGILGVGDNITIENIAVNKAGVTNFAGFSGICVAILGNDFGLSGSQLKGCSLAGLGVLGNSSTVADNQIRNNTVANILVLGDNHILLRNRSQDTLLINIAALGDSTTIDGNITRTSVGFGVLAFMPGGSVNIQNNDIGHHTLVGLAALGGNPNVTNNTVQGGVIGGLIICPSSCGTGVGTRGNAFNRASLIGLLAGAITSGYNVDANAALANGAIGIAALLPAGGQVLGNATDASGFGLLGASGASNLLIAGDDIEVENNLSIRSGADGIVLFDGLGVLTPGGSDFVANESIRSARKGFNIGNSFDNTAAGTGNSFQGDIALVNRGEGFGNFDSFSSFTQIQSSGNHPIDCANGCAVGDPFCAPAGAPPVFPSNAMCAVGGIFTAPNVVNFN